MKRIILPAGLVLAAAAPAAAGAAVGSATPTPAHAHAYQHVYTEVAGKLGHRVPGRNILKDGVSKGRAATDAEVVRSLSVLERMLAAASTPVITSTTTSTSAVTSAAPASSAGASGVPACASESGTNYSTGASNTNASSGATGRYQITPGTAAAYGCSLSTPAGQDACAQQIYAHQGAGAWVGCGG